MALVVIAVAVAWPLVSGWVQTGARHVAPVAFELKGSPPPGAPPRPSSSAPGPDERVALDLAWRKALGQPFEDLEDYARQLDDRGRQGVDPEAWRQAETRGYNLAAKEGTRGDYNGLYGELKWGSLHFSLRGDYTPREVAKLEASLELLHAKYRAACKLLDREHELTMQALRGELK